MIEKVKIFKHDNDFRWYSDDSDLNAAQHFESESIIYPQMEDNKGMSSKKSRPRARFMTEEAGDSSVECSGKHCRSCAAALVADCVALCCCPLALVSLLALAFVKVPYMVGRKCLRKRKNKKRKCKKLSEVVSSIDDHSMEISHISGRLSHSKSDIIFEFEKDGDNQELDERRSFCAAFEADKVLFELYQVGHLGFGRVSYTGIQSFGKEI